VLDWERVRDITDRIAFDHRDDRRSFIVQLFGADPIPDNFARLSGLEPTAFVVELHHLLAKVCSPELVDRHLELLRDRAHQQSDVATLDRFRARLREPRSRNDRSMLSGPARPATDVPTLTQETLRRLADVRAVAEAHGCAAIDGAVFSATPVESSLETFLEAIDRMPADLYDAAQTRRRFVSFAHLYHPDDHAPSVLYFMKASLDPASGSRLFSCLVPAGTGPDVQILKFAPVPDEALACDFLGSMVESGFHAAPLRPDHRCGPFLVDVQVIRYEPRRGTEAPIGPLGESWATCLFVLEEENVEGPEHVIYSHGQSATLGTEGRDTPPLDRFTLSRPLAGYCIDHTKVVPYCGPTRMRRGYEYGRKTLLALSYRPLVPLGPDDEKLVRRSDPQPDRTGALAPTTAMPPAIVELSVRSRRPRGATRGQATDGSDTAQFRLGMY